MQTAVPNPQLKENTQAKSPGKKMFSIKWVKSEAEIPSQLWEECFPPPFEGRWWYSVLERSGLESQFQFSYGLLSSQGKLIGIVPVFLNDVPIELVAPDAIAAGLRILSKAIPSCGYQRTLFVGSPCADEGTVGLIPGINLDEVVTFIHVEVIKLATLLKAPMIVWKDFPGADECALDILCTNGQAFKMTSYPGTVVHLQEATMDAYLKGLKSSHRHNLLKKLKRSKQKFPLQVSTIQIPTDKELDEIFALFWQTYERGKTKFERLDKKFFSLIAQQKEAWFVMLREPVTASPIDPNTANASSTDPSPTQGKLVAFMLCFLIGDRIINKFIGLDYSQPKEASLYFRLWEAAVEWTVSHGIKELQSGQTGYRFKLDIGNSLIPLFNYCQNRNPLINFIFAKVASTVSWASLDEDLRTYIEAHPEADLTQ